MSENKEQIFIVAPQGLFRNVLKAVAKPEKGSTEPKWFSFLSLEPQDINLIFQRLKEGGEQYKAVWLLDAGLPNLTESIKQIRKNLPKELNDIVILVTAADICRQPAVIALLNQSLQWGSLKVNKIITHPVKLEKIINF